MKKLLLIIGLVCLFSFTGQKKLKFEFTVDEVQVIYDALGELPAKFTQDLRLKIMSEAKMQLDTTKKK